MALPRGTRGTTFGLAARDRGLPPSAAARGPEPRLAAFLFLVLALVPEIKFRSRDPDLAFSGSLDYQILVELAFYGAVGIWVAHHAFRGMTTGSYRLSALDMNAAALLFVTVVILVSGAYSLSVRSGIRTLQFAELAFMTLLLLWEGRRDHEFFQHFWLWLRRGMLAFAVATSLITLAVPGWRTAIGGVGITRYQWFQIHPITTAGMIGMALIMLVSAFLGQTDPLAARRGPRLAAGLVGLGLTWALVVTRARGAIAATLVAVALLLLLSPQRQRRRLVYLAAAVGITAFVVYLSAGGWAQLEEWILRGQTTEQIGSLSQRTALFEIGWKLFASQPVFGYGYLLAGAKFRNYFEWAGHGHNVLLEIVVSLGLVGLFAFLVLIGVAVTRLWRGMRIPPIRGSGLPAEGLALLALLLAQGVVSDSFGGAVGFETAGLMLVVLIASWSSHMPTPRPALPPRAGPGRWPNAQRRKLLTER